MVQVDSGGDREVRQVLPNILPRCRLGEGCVWDSRSGRLYFVDIEGCKIYGIRPGDGTGEIWEFDTGDMAGCLAPCKDGIVAAVGHRLIRITGDGKRTEVLTELPLPDYVRFNDGKCDAAGRLWVGTMAKSQEHPEAKGCGSLYCIDGNEVIADYSGYTIPNGMAWDGNRFYHIDTSRGMIEEYRMTDGGRAENKTAELTEGPGSLRDGKAGAGNGREYLAGRKTVVTVDPADGAPDGMTIDSEGNLWTAMWGGGKVNCYDPRTGRKLAEIPVPAKNVSCVTFGDADLKTLYMTTAMDENGLGGRLYAVRLPVAGVLPYEYGG